MRRPPSRTMPPRPEPEQPAPDVRLVQLILLILLIAFLWYYLFAWVVLGGLAVSIGVMSFIDVARRERLAAERAGESICTFARSFDCRRVDTWIIRAVFEELQPWSRTWYGVLPLRQSDLLGDVFGIVDEDLDDLVVAVAARVGRSLSDCSANPVRPVATVGDLVTFLMEQPKLRAA